MDSSRYSFNIKQNSYYNLLGVVTGTQEDFIIQLLALLLSSINLNKAILELKYVDCVQQIDNNCGLNVLKNIEFCIINNEQLINNPNNRQFLISIRRCFQNEEATELRFRIVKLFYDITGIETEETIRAIEKIIFLES